MNDAGLDGATVDGCLERYLVELDQLDAEIDVLVDGIPVEHRHLVTTHDSLGYFAHHYGFEIVGTVIPASAGLAETNAAHLEELAGDIADTGARAIFTEVGRTSDNAEALAARVGNGVAVVPLYAGTLGQPGSGADTYIGLMRSNATAIANANQ